MLKAWVKKSPKISEILTKILDFGGRQNDITDRLSTSQCLTILEIFHEFIDFS